LTTPRLVAVDLGYLADGPAAVNSATFDFSKGVSAPLAAAVLGGAGKDTVNGSIGAVTNADVYFGAYLPGNDDTFNASVTGAVSANSSVNIAALGAAGNDTINITSAGLLNGAFRVYADGGDGNDTVAANLTADAGSTGSVYAVVRGGFGDDK